MYVYMKMHILFSVTEPALFSFFIFFFAVFNFSLFFLSFISILECLNNFFFKFSKQAKTDTL